MSVSIRHRHALPIGYPLAEYQILSILGHGGFGITYLARDLEIGQDVAIKEYLPREIATRKEDLQVAPISEDEEESFAWGMERFLDEARTLTRFRHPNIIGIRRFLRAHGTAYLIMDYCAGDSLDKILERETTLSSNAIRKIFRPILDALEEIHNAGVMHRDIKPGNIYLRADGSPVLLDFGSARQALAQHSRSLTAIVSPGYAPIEQYSSRGNQGPWTDIYGLGATLYRCVTGQRPMDASDRIFDDELVPATRAASGYSRDLLELIDTALRLKPEDRPQSISQWLGKSAHEYSLQPEKKMDNAPGKIHYVAGPFHQKNKTRLEKFWTISGIFMLSLISMSFCNLNSPPFPTSQSAPESQSGDVRARSASTQEE